MTRRLRARSPLILNPTLQLTVIAEVSRRGRHRARITVTDPSAVRAIVAGVTTGRRVAIPPASRRQLVEDGVLVHRADVPGEVNLEVPLDRIRLRNASPAPSRLSIASGAVLLRGPAMPAEVERSTASDEPFLAAADLLWVRDHDSGITVPYTMKPTTARAVARALSSPTTRLEFPSSIAALLHSVGALEAPGESAVRRRDWKDRVRAWRVELRRNGCVAVRDLLPLAFAEALRAYFAALEREGYLYNGEMRLQGLPLLHGEPVLEFLAGQLLRTVRAITRETVRPSFTPYLRVYDPGVVLERHHDRPVCRWNVDLVVGGDPAPARRTAWPLWIAHKRHTHRLRLGLGDAVLYRGTEVSHWRRPHPGGATTAIASLHYGAPPRA